MPIRAIRRIERGQVHLARRRRSQTTPDDRPAASPATTAATKTPAHESQSMKFWGIPEVNRARRTDPVCATASRHLSSVAPAAPLVEGPVEAEVADPDTRRIVATPRVPVLSLASCRSIPPLRDSAATDRMQKSETNGRAVACERALAESEQAALAAEFAEGSGEPQRGGCARSPAARADGRTDGGGAGTRSGRGPR